MLYDETRGNVRKRQFNYKILEIFVVIKTYVTMFITTLYFKIHGLLFIILYFSG